MVRLKMGDTPTNLLRVGHGVQRWKILGGTRLLFCCVFWIVLICFLVFPFFAFVSFFFQVDS